MTKHSLWCSNVRDVFSCNRSANSSGLRAGEGLSVRQILIFLIELGDEAADNAFK